MARHWIGAMKNRFYCFQPGHIVCITLFHLKNNNNEIVFHIIIRKRKTKKKLKITRIFVSFKCYWLEWIILFSKFARNEHMRRTDFCRCSTVIFDHIITSSTSTVREQVNRFFFSITLTKSVENLTCITLSPGNLLLLPQL